MDNNNTIVNTNSRHVELYQLVIAVILVMGSIASSWVNINSRISILEAKREVDDAGTVRLHFVLDKILENQTKTLIELEKKQNRSN